MSRLKGTTLVAFFFERFNGKEIVTGIMLGADSRLSNKKRFQDDGKKILRIGKNILILMAGNGDGCEKMCAHLTGKLNNPVEVGSLKVEDVLDMVVNYLNANLHVDGDNSNIGSLVAGWDEKEGLQVYRTKLKDQWVHWEGEHNYVSVGNGREHALHFLGKYYERKMSPENAAELALGALYAATNDPFTGGPLQVILVTKKDGTTYITSMLWMFTLNILTT
uniref:proteasome subunit beta type-5-like n=1 Tax=Fragaria vesca subsp. vesca TaxID=101020 RepID=UPI0005C8D8D8|nr:PREDICTED: proteasome subunit beta type-5-like [Fragaria vesca subsp. vesca]